MARDVKRSVSEAYEYPANADPSEIATSLQMQGSVRAVSDGLIYAKNNRNSVFDTHFDPSIEEHTFDFGASARAPLDTHPEVPGYSFSEQDDSVVEFQAGKRASGSREDILPDYSDDGGRRPAAAHARVPSNSSDGPKHVRNSSESSVSTTSNASSSSTLTPSSAIPKDKRFVRYAMSTQSKSSPSRWNINNVVKWLDAHQFNNSWKDTFRRNEISGNRFLELCNYDPASVVWKQFSKFLTLDNNLNSIERFIDLLREQSTPSVPEIEEPMAADSVPSPTNTIVSSKSDRKPNPVFKHRATGSTASASSAGSAKQRPFSYIDPSSYKSAKDTSAKFFRKHLRHNSGDVLSSTSSAGSAKKTTKARPHSYYPASKTSPAEEAPPQSNRKSGIFSTFRKYGGDKAAGIVKQVQNSSKKDSKSPRVGSPISPGTEYISPHLSRSSTALDNQYLSLENMPSPRSHHSDVSYYSASVRSVSLNSATSELEGSEIHKRYLPKKKDDVAHRSALVTRDNKTFTLVDFAPDELTNVDMVKDKIIRESGVVNIGHITFHLTELNHHEGEYLTDACLVKSIEISSCKILIRQELSSGPETNSISVDSSDSKSFELRGEYNTEKFYPATPQYLLQGTKNDAVVDYLNFKEVYEKKLTKINESAQNSPFPFVSSQVAPNFSHQPRNAAGANAPFKLSLQNKRKAPESLKVPQLQINTAQIEPQDTQLKSASSAEPSTTPSGFRVLRKDGRGEIDFDKRRKSPFDAKPPKHIPNIYSSSAIDSCDSPIKSTTFDPLRDAPLAKQDSIIAKRAAPPPPLHKTQSLKRGGSIVRSATTRRGLEPKSSNPSMRSLSFNRSSGSSKFETRTTSDDAFKETEVVFKELPKMEYENDNGSEDDFFVKPMKSRSSTNPPSAVSSTPKGDERKSDSEDDDFFMKPIKSKDAKNTQAKAQERTDAQGNTSSRAVEPLSNSSSMVVRPPVEELYNNLERYFPNTNLDKPIIDDSPVSPRASADKSSESIRPPGLSRTFSSANVSPSVEPDREEIFYGEGHGNKLSPRRMKTIRVVANEARRKRLETKNSLRKANGAPTMNSLDDARNNSLRRTNTKMWGQKVVEVTSKEIEKGFVSKLRNKKGQFQEFAWIKGELIGRGSFGSVYVALNVTTGEMLAVKQVIVPRNYTRMGSSKTSDGIDALIKEVETMKDLDHVNIVQYLGFEQKNNIYSLFLEYVGGGSISSCLKSYCAFEEPLVCFITRQVLFGLEYLHSNEILHRDLKADNLLLEIDGTCKISDFGISKRSKDIYVNNAEMSMQGTVFWMAPEVIDSIVEDKKQGYSAKVDIWSLGCVVLEMFVGTRPWSNEAVISAIYKIGKTKLAPPISEDIKKRISPQAKDFIDQCFTINAEDRPTAKQLLRHPFVQQYQNFDFTTTKLAHLIKYNSKKVIPN